MGISGLWLAVVISLALVYPALFPGHASSGNEAVFTSMACVLHDLQLILRQTLSNLCASDSVVFYVL